MKELSSLEEKMEYQLEERTRDMQDMLESCQTKVTSTVDDVSLTAVTNAHLSVMNNSSADVLTVFCYTCSDLIQDDTEINYIKNLCKTFREVMLLLID